MKKNKKPQKIQLKAEVDRILERCRARDSVEFGKSAIIVNESDSF